ncbi:adenylate/guanylate cyclase domain-containing protein [Parasulfuritortus cantonensis]|uniref:Adenylate/guanylate cyclase domain-containing protein n=1 Tax=Parasulfuritortus cantonensis TaxID=2528202 RepID=A0A4R1B7S3_9PROT|nr:adenylate/guanylate cyclase domain-containing protein [Parasulfuritortus cantonensis]TCJ11799.1 adenylate/guanylate cyclase domain-containing protein [Parasulfuritortus cantonensis]
MTLPKPNPGWLIPIAAVLAGIALYLIDPLPLQGLRNNVFDQYQRWKPRQYEPVPVRVIDIDDESLARLGQWPWPRTRIAELIDRLRAAGAASIAFDVMFAEPDRTSPSAIEKVWRPDADLSRRLAALPDHDAVLARTLSAGGVVLGHALLRKGTPPAHFATPFRVVEVGGSPLPYLPAFQGTVAALPELQDAAAGNGAITFIPDSDGVVRRVPLLFDLGGKPIPSLVAEALRVGQGARNLMVKTDAEAGTGIQSVRIGAFEVPTNASGQVWVHYTRPVAGRYIPAWKVFAGQVPAAQLEGHVLLVGTSAQGLMDLRFSPLGGLIPGVESHAQAIEEILLGSHLSRPNWAPGLEMLGILFGGLLVGFIGLSAGAILSAAAAMVTITVTGAASWYAYAEHGLLLDPVTPALVLLVIFILASIHHHATAERRQRWVKRAFSRYVSPNLVSYLVDNPNHLELGGVRRECSFIFTDLAGFTNLMEKLDPAEAVALLNDYLDSMIHIAFEHDGTLDRIVGDAVAIMFSAPVEQPDHRQRAMTCAVAMHRFAQRHAAAANARGVPFGATRIGIHTGEVTVGNFGGSTIFDYRALGDPVNTASRLESVNKQLGTLVCVSEATLSGCVGTVARPVGKLVLKGKSLPLMVYQPLIPDAGESAPPDPEYEAAYRRMAAGDPAALATFEALAEARPDDPLVRFHLGRLHKGQTGDVITFTEK